MYKEHVIDSIKDVLIAKRKTLAIAESVTAGHIQAAVSLATKATSFFQGGLTAYNLNEKTRLLHVDVVHAMSCNCVSEKVAGEMAVNVAKLFQSDWGISITGYATPVPDLGVNNLFAYWAASHQGKVIKAAVLTAEKDQPLNVQVFYANEVLKSFLQVLNDFTE
ncbi:MAG TPA: nicotinamide-nucleotide amidohydrolase family protein [Chryseosolibacter sp.]